MGPKFARNNTIKALDLVVRAAMSPKCMKGSRRRRVEPGCWSGRGPKMREGSQNRRVGLGRQGGHGPTVRERSQKSKGVGLAIRAAMGPTCVKGRKFEGGGPIVKAVGAPNHYTCALDLIVKVDLGAP